MPTLTGCSVCLKRALAIAKSFSRGSASIAIASEFFWVSVMVVFMVACGLQKYTPCCKGLRLRIWVHTIYYQPGQLQEFRPPEGRITCNSLRVRDRLNIGARPSVASLHPPPTSL